VFSISTAEYFSSTVKVISDYAHNVQLTVSFDDFWGRIKEKDFHCYHNPHSSRDSECHFLLKRK